MPSRSGRFRPPLRIKATGALMHSSSHKLLFAGAAVYLWLCVPLAADPIYKWEGPDGVTHYSETPPAAAADVNLEVLELSPRPPSQPGDTSDYRSALDVADSLQAARLERERLRLKRQRSLAQAREARQEARQQLEAPRYAVPWFFPPHRLLPPPGRGGHAPPHPDQPRVHRPPDTAPEPPLRGRVIVDR